MAYTKRRSSQVWASCIFCEQDSRGLITAAAANTRCALRLRSPLEKKTVSMALLLPLHFSPPSLLKVRLREDPIFARFLLLHAAVGICILIVFSSAFSIWGARRRQRDLTEVDEAHNTTQRTCQKVLNALSPALRDFFPTKTTVVEESTMRFPEATSSEWNSLLYDSSPLL